MVHSPSIYDINFTAVESSEGIARAVEIPVCREPPYTTRPLVGAISESLPPYLH